MLRYDSPSPITVEQFLAACKSNLGSGDYHQVQCALDGTPSGNRFLKKYQTFCQMVQSELSEQRAHKLGMSPETYRNDGAKSYVIAEAVRKALADENVLDGEMALIVLKWNHLDEMSAQHVFDLDGLLAYALKLGIITRKSLFTQEAGNAEFQRLFQQLESDIKSM